MERHWTLIEDSLIGSVEDLYSWISEWINELDLRSMILLEGQMGAGKTQFAKCLAELRGSPEANSPSYAVIQSYPSPSGTITHLDLYRLKDNEDLDSTGFWDLMSEEKGLILIEWGDLFDENQIPPNWSVWRIEIAKFKGEVRQFKRFKFTIK